MPKIRTVALWVGALELVGLFFVIKGYRARDHAQSVTIGDLFRPGAAVAPANGGDSLPASPGSEALPADSNGRVVWFSKRYSERYASAERQMALNQGADAGLLPAEWPQAKYIADASAYPGVETYFLGYLRYLDKAKEHYPVLMDSVVTITIAEAKLRSADSADVIKELNRALAAKRETNLEMFNRRKAYGQAALSLHYFLASVGSRVTFDSSSNAARFKVDTERERAGVLLAELQNSAAKLGAASRLR